MLNQRENFFNARLNHTGQGLAAEHARAAVTQPRHFDLALGIGQQLFVIVVNLDLGGGRVAEFCVQADAVLVAVAGAALIPHVVARPEDVIGHVDAVLVSTDDGAAAFVRWITPGHELRWDAAMKLPPEVNLLAVTHYLQALEVQRMTLSTLQTMNLPMADLRSALTLPTPAPMWCWWMRMHALVAQACINLALRPHGAIRLTRCCRERANMYRFEFLSRPPQQAGMRISG